MPLPQATDKQKAIGQSIFGSTPQSTPQSTVSEPITNPNVPDPTQGFQRDLNREQSALQRLGLSDNPLAAASLSPKLLFETTYTPAELAQIPEYQNIKALEQSTKTLSQTPPPSASLLRPLETGLRMASDIGNQELGQSKLFEAAGLTGYSTLLQSLQQRSNEIGMKNQSFANQVALVGEGLRDTYESLVTQHSFLKEEYDTQSKRLQDVVDGIIDYERSLDYLQKQHDLSKELAEFKAGISGGGRGGGGGGGAFDFSLPEDAPSVAGPLDDDNLERAAKALALGVLSEEQIRSALANAGYSEEEIAGAIERAGSIAGHFGKNTGELKSYDWIYTKDRFSGDALSEFDY